MATIPGVARKSWTVKWVPTELSIWMEGRQKDLQEALSMGDHSRAVTLSLMLMKGAERMVEMTRQDISNDEFSAVFYSGQVLLRPGLLGPGLLRPGAT